MLNKVLASVGIGAATVETRLADDLVRPGGTVAGEVVVEGGKAAQRVSALEHRLTAARPADGDDLVLDSWQVAREFVVEAGDRRTVSFEARVHPETPVTEVEAPAQETEVWLETALSLDRAIDASDTTPLRVGTTPVLEDLLAAMRSLGFELQRVEEKNEQLSFGGTDAKTWLTQSFTFRPTDREDARFGECILSVVQRPMENYSNYMLELSGNGEEETLVGGRVDHPRQRGVESLAAELDDEIRGA